MLQLQYHNLLIQSILTEKFAYDATPTSIDQIISDFDNVTFHVSTPETKSKILISLYIKCFADLQKHGVEASLKKIYGKYVADTVEPGYNFSLYIDLAELPEDPVAREELVTQIALLKRNAMAAPFEKAFQQFDEMSKDAAQKSLDLYAPDNSNSAEVMALNYRDEESIYIKPSHDRVTVIFSTIFKDETDKIFGKVFLQEFVDARRRAIQNAPQVLFSQKEPPLEIKHLVPVTKDEIGYVTFVLFPRHLTVQRRENCISQIQIFRDYFHYHIKCSKAYMHSRMRYRVSEFLKVLNRAKPEIAEREKKTASGRRFNRD